MFQLDTAFLQAVLVEGVAFQQLLPEGDGGPDAKLGDATGVDAVAHRDNGVEVVVFDRTRYFPHTLLANYREVPGSCQLLELVFVVGIFKVQTNVVRRGSKKLANLALVKPQGFLLKLNLKLNLAVLGGIDLNWLVIHRPAFLAVFVERYTAPVISLPMAVGGVIPRTLVILSLTNAGSVGRLVAPSNRPSLAWLSPDRMVAERLAE